MSIAVMRRDVLTVASAHHNNRAASGTARRTKSFMNVVSSSTSSLSSSQSLSMSRSKKISVPSVSFSVSGQRPRRVFAYARRARALDCSACVTETVTKAAKKSVGDLTESDLKGKFVLVRADLNVPLDGSTITDDTRIRAAIPTIEYLVGNGAKVLLTSHLGRPKGVTEEFRLTPVAARLAELLSCSVTKADDCIGDEVSEKAGAMDNGSVLLLENVRFYSEETKNDPSFAEKLASPADLYVNDAFGTAHRAHASTEGVTKFLSPSVCGFLMQKELDFLDGAVASPVRPFTAIVGGSKVSSKIGVIESLMEKVDTILLGGGMIFTFYKAMGYSVGSSLVEDDKVDLAKDLMKIAEDKGVKLMLPTDVHVTTEFSNDSESKIVDADKIPDGYMGLDIGPASAELFANVCKESKTVLWNGPMGVFEMSKYATGTNEVATALASLGEDATTIIGGGDSVAAVEGMGLGEKMTHISTGGGASLELLEGKILPGVAALDEK